MTIHKSKGLEYKAVFFLGLEDAAWWNFARQPEEETCAFFVAFSRAKKRVYFTYCDSRLVRGGSTRSRQSRDDVVSLYRLLQEAGATVLNLRGSASDMADASWAMAQETNGPSRGGSPTGAAVTVGRAMVQGQQASVAVLPRDLDLIGTHGGRS